VRRALCALLLLAACRRDVEVVSLPSGAVVPYVSGGGAISYVDEKARAFRTMTWRDGAWSEPRTIVADPAMLINRADFPSISASGNEMVAAWSTRREHGSVIHVARSTDAGATWSAPRTPHPDVVSQFGFVALAGDDFVFLDGRRLQGGMEGSGDMELRAGDGTPLDTRVCDCCQTAIAMTDDGPIVAYRDRSADEVRDISLVRRVRGRWTKPVRIQEDNWQIPGCPVNGPQVDAAGKRVAVAWFTAAGNDPRAFVAFSNDGGATFAKPIRIDAGPVAGRVDVALLPDGTAAVSWVVQSGDKSNLRVRRIHPNGTLGEPRDLGECTGFPRTAVWDENVAVVWSSAGGARLAIIERL
jgi:hypothetical protein